MVHPKPRGHLSLVAVTRCCHVLCVAASRHVGAVVAANGENGHYPVTLKPEVQIMEHIVNNLYGRPTVRETSLTPFSA